MEFFDVLNKRRSVRKFTSELVPPDVISKSIDAALLAPNSSNLQLWEFYWIKSADKKKSLIEFCFSQNAAATAQELVVAVSRVDTWERNRDLLLVEMKKRGKVPDNVIAYYTKLIPIGYMKDLFGIIGLIKWVLTNIIGLFKVVPRGPLFKHNIFEVVSKSAALACENFMLAIVAQGYDTCPMEGFDEKRVKKLLGLGKESHIVMVFGVGKADPAGIFGERLRLDRSLFVHEV